MSVSTCATKSEIEARMPGKGFKRLSAASDCEAVVDCPPLLKSDRVLLSLLFCLQGVMTLLPFNGLVNLSEVFENAIWKGTRFSDTLLFSFQGGCLASVVLLTYFRGLTLKRNLFRITSAATFIGFVVLSLPAILFVSSDGNANRPRAAKTLLAIAAVALGVCSGVYQIQGFSYCGILPQMTDQAKFVSLGLAVSGVFAWCFFSLGYEVIFPDRTSLTHQRCVVILLCAAAIGGVIITALLFERVLKIPAFNLALSPSGDTKGDQEAKSSRHSLLSDNSRHDVPGYATEESLVIYNDDKHSTWHVVRRALYPAMRPGIVLAVTFSLFPTMGPLSWPIDNRNIQMGLFQNGDAIIRSLFLLSTAMLLGERFTDLMIYLRPLIFIPFFLLPVVYPSGLFIADARWLTCVMIAFVFTHSASFTCSAVHCMRKAKGKFDVEIYACLMTLCVSVGAFLGVILAKVLATLLA